MRATRLHADDKVAAQFDAGRRYWLHVASGEIAIDERRLVAGDALGFLDQAATLTLSGIAEVSDVLLFELPA